jgi:hypothetical protein
MIDILNLIFVVLVALVVFAGVFNLVWALAKPWVERQPK